MALVPKSNIDLTPDQIAARAAAAAAATAESSIEIVAEIPPPLETEMVEALVRRAANVQTRRKEREALPYDDNDFVTVLRGYGINPPDLIDYIDNWEFIGGVARHVPYRIAKHWYFGTMPGDIKHAQQGRVVVHILDHYATEADFIRVTGMRQLNDIELSAQIQAKDLTTIAELLGPDKMHDLVTLWQRHESLETPGRKASQRVSTRG